MDGSPLTVIIDGQEMALALAQQQRLPRAVIISLFTWRRARPDDELPSDEKFGWWGDTFPPAENDKIGSRLWLLSRAKIMPDTALRAKEYIEEALAWLVADGIAGRVEVQVERQGLSMLAAACRLYKPTGQIIDIRFSKLWDFLQ